MPRSKSFMNVSGQYNLQELFKELKEKEGIESVDDILRQVVKQDGMSFHKISPMHRELLMKLAMSMSADEMFIRSKNIIMKEKLQKNKLESSSAGGSAFAKIFSIFGFGGNQKKSNNMNNMNNNNSQRNHQSHIEITSKQQQQKKNLHPLDDRPHKKNFNAAREGSGEQELRPLACGSAQASRWTRGTSC